MATKDKAQADATEEITEKNGPGDGILIRYDEKGQRTHISPLGGVRATELPTLLRQAAGTVERELGV